jgi:hypothetical protein
MKSALPAGCERQIRSTSFDASPALQSEVRKFSLFILAVLCATSAFAESARPLKLDTPASSDKPVPLKGKASSNSCAAYGPGFVKVEGTNTCVQIGGSISVGAGVRR